MENKDDDQLKTPADIVGSQLYSTPIPTEQNAPPVTRDTTAIYPTPTKSIGSSQSFSSQPATVPDYMLKPSSNRVSSRVPALQTLAFLIIAFSLLSILNSFAFLAIGFGGSHPHFAGVSFWLNILSSILGMVFGVYLLNSRSAQRVSTILTIVLVLYGLDVLNTLFHMWGHGFGGVYNLVITGAIMAYLFYIKLQIDDLA